MTTRPIRPLETPFDLSMRPPGSKSHTIRALVLSTLAEGVSELDRPLDADDTRFARDALSLLGARIEIGDRPWAVTGTGGDLLSPPHELDAGASGLTARALIAVAALVEGPVTIVGRDRLPERPMSGLVEALRSLEVEIATTDGGLPITVRGRGALPGGAVAVESSQTTQFATALLLAAPMAAGSLVVEPTGVKGSERYLDVTLDIMRRFGAEIDENGAYTVSPTGYLATKDAIEPDASAAAYPMVAAAVTGSRVQIDGLGSGSMQPDLDVADVLEQMGCSVVRSESSITIDARGRSLHPVEVDLSGSPDGALAVAAAALFADGASTLRGLGSLRFKESDRLAALASELSRLGAGALVEDDELIIEPAPLRPVTIETHGDHRIAMSLAVVGLAVPGIEIADPGVVAKTWPGYWDMLETLSASTPR